MPLRLDDGWAKYRNKALAALKTGRERCGERGGDGGVSGGLDAWVDRVAFSSGRPLAHLCEEALSAATQYYPCGTSRTTRRVPLPSVSGEWQRKLFSKAMDLLNEANR